MVSLSCSELCPGSGWCRSELSPWHSAACPRGQRQVLSAWPVVGCHLWLVLGFPRTQPRARRAEGGHRDHLHAGPWHSCGTLAACWVVRTHSSLSASEPVFHTGSGRCADLPRFPQVQSRGSASLTYCLLRSPPGCYVFSKSGSRCLEQYQMGVLWVLW